MSEGPARADVATCPEHLLSPALGSCERCGRFVCEACAAAREPLRCAACLIIEERTTTLGALPFTFGSALSQGAGFFWRNLPVLAGLALIFAIPEGLIAPRLPLAMGTFLGLPELAFIAACTLAIHRRESGAPRAGLGASLVDGLRSWPQVFVARFLANIQIFFFGLLLIVPGVMRALSYAVVIPSTLLNGEGIDIDVLEGSRSLTHGRRWPILGLMALSSLASLVAGVASHILSSFGAAVSESQHGYVWPLFGCASRMIILLAKGFDAALILAIFVGLLAHERAEKEPPAVT